MNKFIFLLLFLPYFSFGQNSWVQSEQGNAFDGYARMAHVWDTTNELGLVVVNKNDEVLLNVNSATDYYKTTISIVKDKNLNSPIDFSQTEKVRMAFNKNKEVYLVNFHPSSVGIIIRDAISEDLKNYIDKYELLDMIKSNKEIHVRIISKNNSRDVTFSLEGANSAIYQTARYTSGKNYSEATDVLDWAQNWKSLYQWKITKNCYEYLEKKYGNNTLRLIDSIELTEDGEELIFYLKFGLGQSRISRNIFLKDAVDENGNFVPEPN